jgi:IS30 family transposase
MFILPGDSRVELAVLLRTGFKPAECAGELGFDKSSVSREISEFSDADGVYRAVHADKRARDRRRKSKQPQIKLAHCGWLVTFIVRKLKKRWSPEQIAGRLKRDHGHTIICHETISNGCMKNDRICSNICGGARINTAANAAQKAAPERGKRRMCAVLINGRRSPMNAGVSATGKATRSWAKKEPNA